MVKKIKAHGLTRLFHALRYAVIVATGAVVAARMVVAESHHRGVAEDSLAADHPHINSRLTDASMRYAHSLDELKVLVHEQHPRLLHIEVLHAGVHIFVDGLCRSEVCTLLCLLALPALAQLTRCKNGHSLCLPHALVAHEVSNRHLPQRVEIVVTVVKHQLHQLHSRHLGRARANENGQQFGV